MSESPDEIVREVLARHVDAYARIVEQYRAALWQLVHLVYCRNAAGLATFYMNGKNVTRAKARNAGPDLHVDSARVHGDFSTWANGLQLGLGDEFSGARNWLGEYYLVAVYARALSEQEVRLNHAAGPPRGNATAGSRRR